MIRVLTFCIALAPSLAAAGPVQVVNPGGSIQAAIEAAEDGDFVHVNTGTYDECLVLDDRNGKTVTLLGMGGASAPVVTCSAVGGTAVSVLDGQLIMRAIKVEVAGTGRGMSVGGSDSSLTVQQAEINDIDAASNASADGGGVACLDGATLVMTDVSLNGLSTEG